MAARAPPVDEPGMEERRSWLCPTPEDRRRLLDMERRLRRQSPPPHVIVFVALALSVFQLPWWLLLFPVASLAMYLVAVPVGKRFGLPEWGHAASAVFNQAIVGVSVAVTGGPLSPLMPNLVIPFASIPARFTHRGTRAFIGITFAILLAATFGVDFDATLDKPALMLATLGTIICVTRPTLAIMGSDVEARAEASVDALTGVFNRKALDRRFAELEHQAGKTGDAVALVVCDIDRFKAINDEHGHDRGDAVLRETAEVLTGNLRSFELAYRIGGEEFVVVLPGLEPEDAEKVAERLRATVEARRPGGLPVTCSFGVAQARGAAVDYDTLFKAADGALYEAKNSGRNRVVSAADT